MEVLIYQWVMLCIFVFHQWFLALIFFLRGMLLEYFNYVLPMFFSLIENTEMKEMKYSHKLPKSMNYRIAVSIMLPLMKEGKYSVQMLL